MKWITLGKMNNIVSKTVLKQKKHLGRWRRKAVQVEMLAEVFLLWMLMLPTEEFKARCLLGLWLQEGIQFHYFRYLFGIGCVPGSGLQVAGYQDEWSTTSGFKQLAEKIRRKPKSCGTCAKSWWGTSRRGWRLGRHWKEFWKRRFLNRDQRFG